MMTDTTERTRYVITWGGAVVETCDSELVARRQAKAYVEQAVENLTFGEGRSHVWSERQWDGSYVVMEGGTVRTVVSVVPVTEEDADGS